MNKQKIKTRSSKIKIKLTEKQKKELLRAEKQVTKPQVLKKILCIQLKDKNWKHKDVAEHLNVRISTISTWIKIYAEQGIKQLISWNYQGKSPKLSTEQIEKIKARTKNEPFDIAQEAVDYIKEEFNIKYNVKYLPRLLKKINCHTKSLA